MSYQIKHIASETIYTVSENPQWSMGVWECGDSRYTDQDKSEFEVCHVPSLGPLPILTPMTFYMAFTPDERIAIKTSPDPYVKEFWDMYQLSVQLNKPTDPNLASIQNALAYLALTPESTPPGPGILNPERVPHILAGIPQ